MIRRYSRPEMADLWTDRRKYLNWLRVEFVVSEIVAEEGTIPPAVWKRLKKSLQKLMSSGGVDPARVEAIEARTRHDVIAFVEAVSEEIGEDARYVHYGLTSSDVVDTAFALSLEDGCVVLQKDLESLIQVLKKRAQEFKDLPTIGRTHGMFAEPTSFGLKFLGWMTEAQRNRERFNRAREGIRYGKLSGAVGASTHWSPQMEKKILDRLKLAREPVSTQVIPRDRVAELMNVLALIGSSLERIAVELRHLQRSEVAELREGFAKGQKGSSAMPHKRNPISSENLTGAARMLRGYSQMCMENIALWHERDISHSAVERVAVPDAFILADYAIQRMVRVIEGLEIDRVQVKKNLEKAGPMVYSGHYLLALVNQGVKREVAYEWVQSCAHQAIDRGMEFKSLLAQHPEISKHLTQAMIEKMGTPAYQLRHVREVYALAERSRVL